RRSGGGLRGKAHRQQRERGRQGKENGSDAVHDARRVRTERYVETAGAARAPTRIGMDTTERRRSSSGASVYLTRDSLPEAGAEPRRPAPPVRPAPAEAPPPLRPARPVPGAKPPPPPPHRPS